MRFRSHLLSSVAAGLLCYPRSPARAAVVVLAGTLIDVDHLVLYSLQTGDWSLSGAIQYDRYRNRPGGRGDTRPRYGSLRSWIHQPGLLPFLWLLALNRPALRPLTLGVSLHLLLDYLEWPRFFLAYRRSGRRCERCGRRDRQLTVHRWRDRSGMAFHTLCRPCYEQGLHPAQ